MKKHVFVALGLAIILMSGCLTQTIQQGKDISSSGIAYTEAVDKLLDVTVDRVIDFDNEETKKMRPTPDLKVTITDKNSTTLDMLIEIERFRTHTKLLKTYFLSLQALADSPIKEDAKGAVQSLSKSFNTLNETLESKVQLTEDQITQIGALGGLVANTIHAAKIKSALERDAEVIGRYLALQENQLETITGTLTDLFRNENDLFLKEKIIAPYVDPNQPLGADWASNRKQWLKSQLVIQQLETAIEAAKQLRGVWEDILQGKTDIKSLSVLIYDVNEFVTTVQALEAAGNTN